MDENSHAQPERTLLPRFSIRTLFWAITISAFAFVVVGMAARGQTWAWGVSIGLASLVITGLVHAAWFGLVYVFAHLLTGRQGDAE
jgi:hypothetical protein